MLDYKKRIAIITPVSHLGIKDLIESKGDITYLENSHMNEIRNVLIEKSIDTIFCNPNKQDYKIDKNLLDGTNVSLVNTCSTGLSHIDLEYCKKNEIKIYSLTKDYELINELPSTSELAFGLMVDSLRHISKSRRHVLSYQWDYTMFLGRQIKDLKIGIIGFGRLGKMMFKYCKAFEADLEVYDPFVPGYDQINLVDFIKDKDVISLHVHLNDDTRNLIDRKALNSCKKSLVIINTSRGGLVDEQNIINMLDKNLIGGYSTDVLVNENDSIKNSKLILKMKDDPRIIITPHVGGMTIEGQTKAYKWAINKL